MSSVLKKADKLNLSLSLVEIAGVNILKMGIQIGSIKGLGRTLHLFWL